MFPYIATVAETRFSTTAAIVATAAIIRKPGFKAGFVPRSRLDASEARNEVTARDEIPKKLVVLSEKILQGQREGRNRKKYNEPLHVCQFLMIYK